MPKRKNDVSTAPAEKTREQVMHEQGFELVPCKVVSADTGKVTMSARWVKKGQFKWL